MMDETRLFYVRLLYHGLACFAVLQACHDNVTYVRDRSKATDKCTPLLVEKTPLVEIAEKGVFYTNAPQVRLLVHAHST
jgi:hypothetical protein